MMALSHLPSTSIKLPRGAWDSHVHVVDEERFPFQPAPPYYPEQATVDDLQVFEKRLDVDNVCLICVSVYGNDNRSIFDALRRIGRGCKAVVSFDPATVEDSELEHMNRLGVRGVRLNLKTRGETPSRETLVHQLHQYASRIRSLGWIIQLYVSLDQVSLIADAIPGLGVNVVIDHMGSPNPSCTASSQPGYEELITLLQNRQVWVKISGTYRFEDLPDLDGYGRALIRAGPRNVVWASDWPHTGGDRVVSRGRTICKYRDVDDESFIVRCLDWCDHDQDMIEKLFVNNPRRLWSGEDTALDRS